ncbi:MAG: hypothetical protein M1825_005272 [Sarcosagium campestre]|nr:MAG: hypothetical protein M1825_005272 [Sarcosagium campestre]
MRNIGEGAKAALLETWTAAAQLVPANLKEEFILVGGTSMLVLGGTRATEDVDIAITGRSLDAFEKAALSNAKFKKGNMLDWVYETGPLCIKLEFLALGSEFVPKIRMLQPAMNGYRAGLADLALMKAHAARSRGEIYDLEDLEFILGKMAEGDENFQGFEMDDEDVRLLSQAAEEIGGPCVDLLKTLITRR